MMESHSFGISPDTVCDVVHMGGLKFHRLKLRIVCNLKEIELSTAQNGRGLDFTFYPFFIKLSVKSPSLSPPIPSFSGICKVMKIY
jgi:hypothetical protein